MQEIEKLLLPLDPHDHPDCQTMHWMNSEISAIKEYAKKCIKPLFEELETLRTENEKLEDKLQEQLCTVGSLLEENAKLIAEREAMMKPKHKRADELVIGDSIKKNGEFCKIFQITNLGGYIKINFDETHLPPEALIEMIYGPLPYGPLPAQQINPFPVLSSYDSVPMPANADQAAAMAILGEAWLKHNAPERLKTQQIPEGYALVEKSVNKHILKAASQISLEKKGYWIGNSEAKYIYELIVQLSASQPKGDV